MARQVKEDAKYDDICLCMKTSCELKTCYRHSCHALYPQWTTMAYLEGVKGYCLKVDKEEENETNKI